MSEILQPGQHPDADQINAFVEHALPAHQQQQTLAHLATCADCRAVLYLAQPASRDESTQPQPVNSGPWFSRWSRISRWNLALPAAAALACLILLTVHLHNTSLRKHQAASITTAYIEPTSPPLPATPPSQSPPLHPASTRIQKPPAINAPSTSALASGMAMKARIVETAPPQPGVHGQFATSGITALARPRPEFAASSREAAVNPAILDTISGASLQSANSSSGTGSMAGSPSANTSLQAGAGTGNAVGPQQNAASANPPPQSNPSPFSAKRTSSPQYQAAPPLPPSAAPTPVNQTVAVADATSIAPESSASSTAIAGAAIATLKSRSAMQQSQPILPSHLAALSTVSNALQRLAIDTAGALFRSEDAGVTWAQVPAQWTGRAVRVSLNPSSSQQMTAKDTGSGSAAATAARPTPPLPAQPAGFELTTDNGDGWISTDGRLWKRK